MSDEVCRLCRGDLVPKFNGLVLHKYEVRYLECDRCGSLQTESPFWLDDAYKLNLSNLDSGAAHCFIVILNAHLYGLTHFVFHGVLPSSWVKNWLRR